MIANKITRLRFYVIKIHRVLVPAIGVVSNVVHVCMVCERLAYGVRSALRLGVDTRLTIVPYGRPMVHRKGL